MHQRVERSAPVNPRSTIDLTTYLFRMGYGDEVTFAPYRIGITWAQFGHVYRNFYVYQHATAISGAPALADQVLSEDSGAAERYLDSLSGDGSVYAFDAFEAIGVDLTTHEPLERAFASPAKVVDRLEALVL